jgi:periplasmic protein TonB
MRFLFVFFVLFSTISFSQEGVFVDPEEAPEFPGGEAGFSMWIAENLIYPQDAIEKGLTGRCYVSFIVDSNGVCKDFKIIKGVRDCPSCDEEALRLVKSMPKWKPGLVGEKPTAMPYRFPISFRLN